MNADEYIIKHGDTIMEALSDYARWFDEGEAQQDACLQAIDDFGKIKLKL